MKNEFIKSPLNYTGGKYRLLEQIIPLFPEHINTFVDLFCGGANVGINVKANKVIYNDYNSKLIALYKVFDKYSSEEIIKRITRIIKRYGLSESALYGYEYYGCNSSDGLGKFNKDHFAQLKEDFNKKSRKDDLYYFMLYVLIIYGFNNQIRFNGKGEYNLPIGKRDFNVQIKNNLISFVEKLHHQEKVFLSKQFTKLSDLDLGNDDFVYCDPPYLITTASYNEKNGWTEQDEKNLLEYLDMLNDKGIHFALSNVTEHKGRKNDILLEWAKRYTIHELDFDYNNSSYHGSNTDKETKEVLITNY